MTPERLTYTDLLRNPSIQRHMAYCSRKLSKPSETADFEQNVWLHVLEKDVLGIYYAGPQTTKVVQYVKYAIWNLSLNCAKAMNPNFVWGLTPPDPAYLDEETRMAVLHQLGKKCSSGWAVAEAYGV